LKTFLILLAIGFALRFLMPYIIKYALKLFVQKQMRKAQQFTYQAHAQQQRAYQANGHSTASATPGNGKIKVDYVPEEVRQKKDFPDGEYVDYEEIK
jgi:acetyl-CoA acetyltransferase